jgi:photosystem II stability/assembly factor-like uncharacterized protein
MILAVALTALLPPAAPCAGELGWHILPNSPSADRHDDVQFLDPDLGWVVNRNGQVWKTTDGGETWELQLQVSTLLRSVHFLDESLGFVGTINAAPDSLLYRTTNGGASWTNVVLPGPLPKGICGLIGVGDHVFASGAYFGNDQRFLHSTDRGATWTNYDLSPYLFNAIDCYFVSPNSGFVVGGKRDGTINHPIILFTADGGQTWETRYYSNGFDAHGYCWKVFFVNPLAGFVSIQGHAILKTTDGGLTWVRKPVSTDTFIQGVGFATEMIGWVDGSNPPSVTTDGGETWNPTSFTGDSEFPWSSGNRFQMLSPSLGYCSGRRIYKFEPITTAVPVTLVTPKSRFHLTSYPNPARGPATISYVLAKDGPARVRVYTVLGRYLRTLHEGWQAAGGNSVLWPGDDDSGLQVGPGIYFYRVDAEGTAETARLVLVE